MTKRGRNGQRDEDTMRQEYDFSDGARGVTAARYRQGSRIVPVDRATPLGAESIREGACGPSCHRAGDPEDESSRD